MFEVRSNKLKTGLSSSNNPVEWEEDTVASGLREVRAFYTLREACGFDIETLSRFRDRFQFPERVRVHLPQKEERACYFLPREVCFYEAIFQCGLRFHIHPFLMELLIHFNVVLRKLMPNSWTIVISYMEIWLAVIKGDMIRVDEFTYLYRLKESTEYGYYSLCPGSRRLGSSPICHRLSNIGNPGSSLCLRMIGRLLPMKSGVTSMGCSIIGEPQV